MAFTFFFRDLPVIEYAADHAVKFASGRMKFKVWDAGCALGQEAYTIAIVLAEKMGNFGFKNLCLEATDHDRANNFGDVVNKAVYSYEELKRMPAELFRKYFEPNGMPDHFRLVDKIRSQVTFRYHDLLSLAPIGTGFSLIVCKNVLLHFQYAQRVEVMRMFHRALLPGGFFTSEQTQKMPQELSKLFEQVVPDSQLYRKVEDCR